MSHVFSRKSRKHIYRRAGGEGCLQNSVASRFGARLAEEKRGRPRLELPGASQQYTTPHIGSL